LNCLGLVVPPSSSQSFLFDSRVRADHPQPLAGCGTDQAARTAGRVAAVPVLVFAAETRLTGAMGFLCCTIQGPHRAHGLESGCQTSNHQPLQSREFHGRFLPCSSRWDIARTLSARSAQQGGSETPSGQVRQDEHPLMKLKLHPPGRLRTPSSSCQQLPRAVPCSPPAPPSSARLLQRGEPSCAKGAQGTAPPLPPPRSSVC